jgi:hypothetical protein
MWVEKGPHGDFWDDASKPIASTSKVQWRFNLSTAQ